MACNSCAKPFYFLRPERGCPGCGFSNCSKCLNSKIFLEKLNAEAKVCLKCKKNAESAETKIDPPEAYSKRVDGLNVKNNNANGNASSLDILDQQILKRINKLKENHPNVQTPTTGDIERRLQKLKGDIPTTTDDELQIKLANIKGQSLSTVPNKPYVLPSVKRSEQEQVEDLLKQYTEQSCIDSNYKKEFDGVITNLELRLQKLKGASTSGTQKVCTPNKEESEDEDTIIKKIIAKAKSEAHIDDDNDLSVKELPFCEICNEDARMRCHGCKYLFCKDCFNDHKDDDDGCHSYDPYTPSNSSRLM